ncbi:hypothetical protein [Myxosarcina sp. GI1]|uniref:hypothetical protein n=1 Tax=Myxosarcina sp. GI1 TaxID=1541065 RepID=UPI0012E082A7|nr:hypothetical protein [Myxosarcina sp. GI1]
MQYKKLTAKILSLALLLGFTTSLIGCETSGTGGDDETAPTEQPEGGEQPEAPEGES